MVERDPTDADIEARLRLVPAQSWDALRAAAAASEREPQQERMTWGGGEQVGTRVVDGLERPVTQMPYAVYSESTQRLIAAVGAVGGVVPYNWPGWQGLQTYSRGAGLDAAPVADAVRMTTAIIRSDRFCEGSIGGALGDGTLLAAVHRLLRWYDDQRGE